MIYVEECYQKVPMLPKRKKESTYKGKKKFYCTVIRLTILYGSEFWALNRQLENKMLQQKLGC